MLHDAAHIRQESHVEHAIDFVEDQNFDISKMHCALLKVIEQPARRRDQDINAAFQVLTLLAIADTTVHDRRAQVGETSIIAKGRFDLRGQLPGWFKNKTAKFSVMTKECKNRESKCRRFASTGLRGTDQVFAGENDRERAQLDGRRLGEPHCLRPANYFGRKSEIVE